MCHYSRSRRSVPQHLIILAHLQALRRASYRARQAFDGTILKQRQGENMTDGIDKPVDQFKSKNKRCRKKG